ncbi:FtsK/SpoIIIE domain-containing protein [Lactococcus raffinolactis]|uniref:FtsK/SpoIIIE domain-containing protein n=1 Tax=Pseudolactococcus raffinolactis TaxID=1366 RepID=UPI00288CA50C|nr:FtsK/SpoIIIE domain-containing protein [Lactococcus raffinolactis]MDT2767075.1 FtsK/SpoIIIE domain-containing protein [Lactococcus raffinolactis]MDT2790192.1 FtsK/SpoIIIE domain-containing protein [Lactococcus raffinolactis]
MKLFKQIFHFKGIKIGKKDKTLQKIIVIVLLLPFLLLFGFLTYLLLPQLLSNYILLIVYIILFIAVSALATFFVYRLLHIKFWFFKKLENRRLLLRHLTENRIFYLIKRKDKKDKIKYPAVYLKQNKYTIIVTLELRGGQFQDKFLNIGGALEVTYSADLMGRIDEKGFVSYVYSADTILGRISAKDVRVVDKGLMLMEDVFWDFVHNPHLLVAGGTGGGKTVLLRSILNGLLRFAIVEMIDPKQADFVSLAELPVLKDRVVYEVLDMINKIIQFKENMEIRYATMRQLQKEKNQKELGNFQEYNLKPAFLIIDEFPSLRAMMSEDREMMLEAEQAMGALKQIILKGRQAGFFAIIATQNVKADDLPSTLKDNIMTRVSVGRLSQFSYEVIFGEENKNKYFKYIEQINGERVYGRGYYGVFGSPAREFFSPELPDPKEFSFYDEFETLERLDLEFDKQDVVVKTYTAKELSDELKLDYRVFKKYKSEFETAGQEFDKTYSTSDLIMFERAIECRKSGKTYQESISEAIL